MTKLFSIFALTSTLILSGCGLSPMIVKEADEKPINGYDIKVSNFEKITNRKINLTFKIDEEGEIEKFPWNEVEQEVKDKLKNQGVILSKEGRPVTVKLNTFRAIGGEYATVKTSTGSMAGGVAVGLGASVIQALAVNAIDRKVADKKANGDTGGGENFMADIAFTVKSNDYESKVGMTGMEAIYGYIDSAKKVTIQAISEFFTPKNN